MVAEHQHLGDKAFQQEILEAESKIGQAISELSRLEAILEDVCREIQETLGFDFVGISLVSPEHHTIEAIYGVGIASKWSGRAKHFLEVDPDLRDIQADIVQTRQSEVVSGWDERFDRWIYDQFDHHQLIRVYSPIVLIQDETGKVLEDWIDGCQWERIVDEQRMEGTRSRFAMVLEESKLISQVIGTVEAGYQASEQGIEFEQVANLAKIVSRRALDIWKAQLPYVLEVIAESAMQIMRADAATLHFLYELDQNHYVYQVFSGELGRRFLKNCPPRHDGLGRQAIQEGVYKFIPELSTQIRSREMEVYNPPAFEAGVKAIAAFPLQIGDKELSIGITQGNPLRDDRRNEGVLYLNFQYEHSFTEEELRWGELFANRAIDAIRQATIYQQTRDKATHLSNLHSVAQSLAHLPDENSLLRHIAWETLNALAADIVTIYEYILSERTFETPPEIAGRLKHSEVMDTGLEKHHVPVVLVKQGHNVYEQDVAATSLFADSPFARRESVQSVAGILLRVDKEIVGVMFINYRRSHYFTPEEKKIIETLSSYAATAIKNQRWLRTLSDIDRKIITTLDQDKLLRLIAQRSVQLTGAEFGMIRFVEPNQRLHTKAVYLTNGTDRPTTMSSSLDEGITGWVAKHRKAALVNDVRSDVRYRSGFDAHYRSVLEGVRSELCVPLLDGNQLLGVLNVESFTVAAFVQRDLMRLQALADRAVVGIQNVQNKNQLINTKTMTTLGDLAAPLVHRMNNDVGAIRVWAQDMLGDADYDSRETAARILELADKVLQGAGRMKTWLQEKPKPIMLHEALQHAITQVNIPSNITRQIAPLDSLPRVLGGEQQLTNVFDNLIQNALDAMPNGGLLSIQGECIEREGGRWIEVKVSDTGVGISAPNLDMIFKADYTTKSARRGMGFGLWWARFYVESLGGYLVAESVIGKTTTFTVKLPVSLPEV